MKKTIKNICLILLILIVATGCSFKKDKKKEENSKSTMVELKDKKITKEQEIDGIKISDVKMNVVDGLTTFNAKATNTTKEDKNIEIIYIIVKDKDDKEIAKLTGYIGGDLKPNESRDIVNTTDIDLSNAKSITYTKE